MSIRINVCINFLSRFHCNKFFTTMEYELFLSLKSERTRLPKLVCMHVTSDPTCINFLSLFQLLQFLMTMDIVHAYIWPFCKVAISPKAERPYPSKIGLHAFHINLYMHKFLVVIAIFYPNGEYETKIWQKFIKRNLRNQRGQAHQNWITCISHQPLHA